MISTKSNIVNHVQFTAVVDTKKEFYSSSRQLLQRVQRQAKVANLTRVKT